MKKFIISILIPLFWICLIPWAYCGSTAEDLFIFNSSPNMDLKVFAQKKEVEASQSGPTEASIKSKNWTFVVGYKAWLNTWQTAYPYSGQYYGSHIVETTSGNEFAHIPNASIKYKDFFISGSYFPEISYDFPKFSYIANYPAAPAGVGTITETVSGSAKRSEWDAQIGYFILSSPIAVTLGYKNVTQKYTTTYTSPGIIYTPATDESKTEYKGPLLGLSGSYPVGAGFNFYGGLAYGWLDVYYDGTKSDDSATYFLADLGVLYKPFEKLPISLSAGYRIQDIDTKVKATSSGDFENTATDITKGFVFGINIIF